MKGTVGVLAARRRKIGYSEQPRRLLLKGPHQLRQGKTFSVGVLPRKTTKIADRLKMDPPHRGGHLQGLPHNRPDGIGVYSFDQGRHQYDTEPCRPGIPDRPEFPLQQRFSPQCDK